MAKMWLGSDLDFSYPVASADAELVIGICTFATGQRLHICVEHMYVSNVHFIHEDYIQIKPYNEAT